jgi:hypothetical protein
VLGYTIKKPLFQIGRLLIAPEIIDLGVEPQSLLRRHQHGDFGCVDPYDIDQNLHAIEYGEEILSQYHVMVGEKKILICLMTEADRSYTVAFIQDKRKIESPETPENGDNQEP